MKIYMHITERIAHTKVKELIGEIKSLTSQNDNNYNKAMGNISDNKQRALYTLARIRAEDYDISDADVKNVVDHLSQLEEGLGELSGDLVKDTPQLFELAEFAAAVDGFNLQKPQATNQSQVAQLQNVAPIIKKIDDIRQRWEAKNFPPEYQDSRPGFYLSNQIGRLSSLQLQYQVSKLFEVIKGNDRSQLSDIEQAAVTLASVAGGKYGAIKQDLKNIKSFFSNETRDSRQAALVAGRLYHKMYTQGLVEKSAPPEEIGNFMAEVGPRVKNDAWQIYRAFENQLELAQESTQPLPDGDIQRDVGSFFIPRSNGRER